MEILLVVLGGMIIVLGYIVYNLNHKLETMEEEIEIAISQSDDAWTYVLFIQKELDKTYKNMKIIDRNGSFQSDDETGSTFKSLLSLLENLNKYILDTNNIIEDESKK